MKRKMLFFLGLIMLFVFLGFGIARINLSENVFAALPKGEAFDRLNQFIESKNISNQVVFSIEVDEETDVYALLDAFEEEITQTAQPYLSNIKTIRPNVEEQVYDYFRTQFPLLIDSSYYTTINSKIQDEAVKQSINAAYQQLASPAGSFVKQFVLNDPLSISTDFFKGLNTNNNTQGIVVDEGVVYTPDRKKILVTAQTNYDPKRGELNIELHHVLNRFTSEWKRLHPNHDVTFFGTFDIAAQNAIQIKKDTGITLIITIVLVLLILVFYYRKILVPMYFILPVVFGGAFALGLVGYVNPDISAISLATSAILLGIILDYSFHFFTHLRHTKSIRETVQEITQPLLVGSLTTILALGALCFADSVVLQNFGLFAAFGLSGAALFTIIGLPVLLKVLKFKYKNIPKPVKINLPKVTYKVRFFTLITIGLLTAFFYYHAQYITFDSEPENLGFHPEELKNKESELAGINPASEKKIYVFASDGNREHAKELNFKVYERLRLLTQQQKVISYLSTAQFVIPDSIAAQRFRVWEAYWQQHATSTIQSIHKTVQQTALNQTAFKGFEEWITSKNLTPMIADDSIVDVLGLRSLIDEENGKTTYLTTLVIDKNNLAFVKDELRSIEGVEVFDRSETAGALLHSVKSDFNYILFVSASIVFIALLLIYGRIELTLLAFVPMAISWIWILGIAALLGIQFNFVNVVVSTFIFGLGDDYSIFVTDGLLNKYKYKKNNLSSYTSAIILSAITTIIGTGALIFAQHPAIKSVALISVLGIVCILFLSLTVQPILFSLFVQKRIDKKLRPVSVFTLILSIITISYFVIGCLTFYPVLFVMALLPINKTLKARVLNWMISWFARSVIYGGIHVKKKIIGQEHLDFSKPSIIIANHASFLDILLMLMLNPKVIIMVKGWVYRSPLFGLTVRSAGYIYNGEENEENLEKIKQRVADGYSLVIFPEGARSDDGHIKRFHKGAFYIAKALNLDITPIIIHGASDVSPKKEYLVRTGQLSLTVLPRITAADETWGTTYQERTKKISAYFKQAYAGIKNKQETPDYLWKRIFSNYMFKGPVLEWYVRIKWKFESQNFKYYDKLIGNRQVIYDLGCGYGYLSYYLHYKNASRIIYGLDYDKEKISIAQHGFDKTNHLNFEYGNINDFEFKATADVIFLNDVLHYLTEQDQWALLEKCYTHLNQNGLLFIRDGIVDLKQRHQTTQKTELFSTKIFSFNKKENDFHFFDSDFIRTFANKHNMEFKMEEQSKKTSNVLFILTKL